MREPDFELSADMRLLELQRGALGLPARERLAWESRGGESGLPLADAPETTPRGALIAVEASALPSEGVIAGAVVTLSLSLANDGADAADDVVVSVPLPGGAAYRPGSFFWNGRSSYDEVAESFFGPGLAIGTIGASERATFVWKIGVRLGTKPLIVAPQVRAGNAAVIGARPLSIARKELTSTPFSAAMNSAETTAYQPKPLIPVEIPATDLPFYELDSEEEIVHEAAFAAMSTATPAIEPEAPAIEFEEPSSVETKQVVPGDAVVLYGRFDRTTLAFFERVFDGTRAPTVLQHAIFAGALACQLDVHGDDPATLRRHLDAQSQSLHRIGLHEKLGKKQPIAGYAGELLADLERLSPESIAASAVPAVGTLLLRAELSEPTLAVISRLSHERSRWDFIKARQLTLALQAQTLAGNDAAAGRDVESALRAYAQASVTALQKLFVRIRIDRTTGLLFQAEPALDVAARAVLAAFKTALA